MTIRPQEVVDEEDAKQDAKLGKGPHGQGHEASERSPGCRCVIL